MFQEPYSSQGASRNTGYEVQKVILGIALFVFWLLAVANGLPGRLRRFLLASQAGQERELVWVGQRRWGDCSAWGRSKRQG
eukprot:12641163-Heterocapsa_arctica.AAC.1